ncbi:hypothetical protein NECAME_01823 [Necator americanus]|uniref:Uncharacterized protein n=1 Tax=Necator americanus TaxID=51031 RepID=W2TMY3_NECAM|nr:hypothetical protein NECAME_01823 [Necator americanus]ETN83024.1 hypothetical protein NECAME_01823 [Necator americanus]
MNTDPAKTQEDIEKTQDGREDDAEKIVKANKYIRRAENILVPFNAMFQVAAEECFKNLEKFLEDASKELEEMFRAEDDADVSVEVIVNKMEECERKRESFAILASVHLSRSCEPFQHSVPPNQPTTLLEQFMDGMDVKDLNMTGPTWHSSLPGRKTEEIEKRKKKRAGFLRRVFQSRKRASPTPQSSMLDDTTTAVSDTPSGISKQIMESSRPESDAKTGPSKIAGSRTSREIDSPMDPNSMIKSKETTDEQKKKKEEKKEKKTKRRRKKPKPLPKSPIEIKKRWWQIW